MTCYHVLLLRHLPGRVGHGAVQFRAGAVGAAAADLSLPDSALVESCTHLAVFKGDRWVAHLKHVMRDLGYELCRLPCEIRL